MRLTLAAIVLSALSLAAHAAPLIITDPVFVWGVGDASWFASIDQGRTSLLVYGYGDNMDILFSIEGYTEGARPDPFPTSWELPSGESLLQFSAFVDGMSATSVAMTLSQVDFYQGSDLIASIAINARVVESHYEEGYEGIPPSDANWYFRRDYYLIGVAEEETPTPEPNVFYLVGAGLVSLLILRSSRAQATRRRN